MFRKLLGFFGIDLAEKGLFPLRLRRRFGLFICLGIVLAIAGSGTFLVLSTRSGFCETCHIMKPFVESWRQSSHGKKGVECIQCHFPPGFQNALAAKFRAASMLVSYLTGTYATKSRAEVQDASCMRPGCHEKRLLEGKVKFKGVNFDHKPHLTDMRRGKRLRCQTCHSQIVQGNHISVTESVCFTCHFKDLKHGRVEEPIGGCTGCHETPAKPITLATGDTYDHKDYAGKGVACYKCHFDSVQGDGNVPKQVCLGCHGEPERLERFDDHEFMHKTHVTEHKVECFHCHSEIRHGKSPERVVTEEPICNRCHQDKHNYTAQLYRGTGAVGVKGKPGPMAAAHVQCIACHQILGGLEGHAPGATYEAGEKSCIDCHGKDVEGVLASWKNDMAGALKKAAADLAKAEAAAKALADAGAKEKADRLLADARHNLDLIQFGKGVHNLDYATAVLEAVSANAAQVVQLGGQK